MATKGIRLHFDGSDNTVFDFRSYVTGKELLAQKVLVNIATYAESDPLYPTRGTTLHQDSINGLIINKMEAQHVGNFAALDTKMFLRRTEENTPDEVSVAALAVSPASYDVATRVLRYDVQITYSDDTTNPVSVKTNG